MASRSTRHRSDGFGRWGRAVRKAPNFPDRAALGYCFMSTPQDARWMLNLVRNAASNSGGKAAFDGTPRISSYLAAHGHQKMRPMKLTT